MNQLQKTKALINEMTTVLYETQQHIENCRNEIKKVTETDFDYIQDQCDTMAINLLDWELNQ